MGLEPINSNKSLTTLEDFLEVITPKTLGCLWITSDPLDAKEKPFNWFDYILDGTLERHILESPTSPKAFFSAQQFNHSFFVFQIESQLPGLEKAMKETFKIFSPQADQNQIICLSQNKKVFSLPFMKNLNDFQFQYFTY